MSPCLAWAAWNAATAAFRRSIVVLSSSLLRSSSTVRCPPAWGASAGMLQDPIAHSMKAACWWLDSSPCGTTLDDVLYFTVDCQRAQEPAWQGGPGVRCEMSGGIFAYLPRAPLIQLRSVYALPKLHRLLNSLSTQGVRCCIIQHGGACAVCCWPGFSCACQEGCSAKFKGSEGNVSTTLVGSQGGSNRPRWQTPGAA